MSGMRGHDVACSFDLELVRAELHPQLGSIGRGLLWHGQTLPQSAPLHAPEDAGRTSPTQWSESLAVGGREVVERIATGAWGAGRATDTSNPAAPSLAYAVGGLPQKKIGAVFGVGRSAVSEAALSVRRELERNRCLRRLV